MSRPHGRDIAYHHAAFGRRVFPFRIERTPSGRRKIPLVPWKSEATTDPEVIRRLWRSVTFGAGWVLPEGLVVVDVDDPDLFARQCLDLPLTATQETLRARGAHHLYRATRDVAQVAHRAQGFDTRVGGRGWVGLYGLDSFEGDIAPAPEWLYAIEDERRAVAPTDAPISSRTEILSLAGRLRWASLSGDEIAAVLLGRKASGLIFDADPSDPWTDEDLLRIAMDYGDKPMGAHQDEPLFVPRFRSRSREGGVTWGPQSCR